MFSLIYDLTEAARQRRQPRDRTYSHDASFQLSRRDPSAHPSDPSIYGRNSFSFFSLSDTENTSRSSHELATLRHCACTHATNGLHAIREDVLVPGATQHQGTPPMHYGIRETRVGSFGWAALTVIVITTRDVLRGCAGTQSCTSVGVGWFCRGITKNRFKVALLRLAFRFPKRQVGTVRVRGIRLEIPTWAGGRAEANVRGTTLPGRRH